MFGQERERDAARKNNSDERAGTRHPLLEQVSDLFENTDRELRVLRALEQYSSAAFATSLAKPFTA